MPDAPDAEGTLDDVLNAALTDPALADLRRLIKQAIDAGRAQRGNGTYPLPRHRAPASHAPAPGGEPGPPGGHHPPTRQKRSASGWTPPA